MARAIGPFDVWLKPLPVDEDLEKQLVGRMSVNIDAGTHSYQLD
ncbi:MAG TPA: hypothetical protein VGG76_10615 [Gemmatimonadaceae bacterium]|jgi:hypothetical protein